MTPPINASSYPAPSAATIAAAVAAPSAATIAAAVAAPSAATIAAAVAAPSAATIAAAVAAPSAAAIVSAGNAAGWNATGSGAINWTNLVNGNTFVGSASNIYTGLSGYKYIKFAWSGVSSSATNNTLYLRINGDTGNTYMSHSMRLKSSGYPTLSTYQPQRNYLHLGYIFSTGWNYVGGEILFDNATNSGAKSFSYSQGYYDTNDPNYIYSEGKGIWNNTAAISSITFGLLDGATVANQYGVWIWGGN